MSHNVIWDLDEQLRRELEQLDKRVDMLAQSAQDMDHNSFTEEHKLCVQSLKEARKQVKHLEVEITQAATDANKHLDTGREAELKKKYHEPRQRHHDKLKSKLDSLKALRGGKAEDAQRARDALFGPSPPGERSEEEMQEMIQKATPNAILSKAQDLQRANRDDLIKAVRIAGDADAIGNNISAALATQEEETMQIIDSMDNLHAQVNRARREVNQITRRLATDKCFICIFILVLLVICVAVGLSIFNKESKDDATTDKELATFEDESRRLHTLAAALRRVPLHSHSTHSAALSPPLRGGL